MAKYLITGGAGFIGSHLAGALLRRGQDVVVLDNLSTGKMGNLRDSLDRLRFVQASVTDLDSVRECCRGVEVVFHQAALASVPRSVADPAASNDANVTGTLNVLMAARDEKVRRVIYAASSSVYGDTEELPKHEGMTPRPQSPYAVSKHVGELYAAVFSRVYGLSTVSLRYFNVFGPRQDPHGQYAAVIPLFISHLLRGKAPTIYGDGEQSRDFTHIQNVVAANLAAAEAKDLKGEVINIACGARITVNALFRSLRDLIGGKVDPVYVPARTGDVRHSLADVSRATRLLGYRTVVDLARGLRETVEWYRETSETV
jgi:nucleoside-diphosphate-sugar epimerase